MEFRKKNLWIQISVSSISRWVALVNKNLVNIYYYESGPLWGEGYNGEQDELSFVRMVLTVWDQLT